MRKRQVQPDLKTFKSGPARSAEQPKANLTYDDSRMETRSFAARGCSINLRRSELPHGDPYSQ
jgi:hypothetical protein